MASRPLRSKLSELRATLSPQPIQEILDKAESSVHLSLYNHRYDHEGEYVFIIGHFVDANGNLVHELVGMSSGPNLPCNDTTTFQVLRDWRSSINASTDIGFLVLEKPPPAHHQALLQQINGIRTRTLLCAGHTIERIMLALFFGNHYVAFKEELTEMDDDGDATVLPLWWGLRPLGRIVILIMWIMQDLQRREALTRNLTDQGLAIYNHQFGHCFDPDFVTSARRTPSWPTVQSLLDFASVSRPAIETLIDEAEAKTMSSPASWTEVVFRDDFMLPTDWTNVQALHTTVTAFGTALSSLYKTKVPVTQVPEAFRLCQQALESLECDADSDSLKVALDEAKAVVDFAYNDTGALYKVAAVLCNFRLDPITESALPAILQMFKELFPEAKDQQEVVEELKTEYSQFAADLKKLRNTNSTQYWIAERTTFRHLSRLALSVIAIPATTMDIFTGLPDSKKIVELIEGLEEGGEGEKDGDSDEEMRKDMLSWCRKNLPKGDQVLVEESLRNLPVI